jgi:transcriptional regulator NrdR family protein
VSTIETLNFSGSLLVAKQSGLVEDFLREKLFLSIYRSLGHRSEAITDAVAITDTIVSDLIKKLKSPIIKREEIINASQEVLKRFDKAAEVHYKAYYPVK